MSKINKTIKYGVVSSLVLLGVLAFGVIALLPKEANAQLFEASNAKPVIHSLSNNPVFLNAGRVYIDIYGENFSFGAVAKIDNSDRTTTFINSKRLQVELLDSDTFRLGGYAVRVYSPGNGLSNSYLLNVVKKELPKTTLPPENSPISQKDPITDSNSNSSVLGASTNAKTNNGQNNGGLQPVNDNNDFSSLASNAIYGSNSFMPSGLVQWLLFAILILLIVIVVRKLFGADKYHAKPLKHA